MTTPATTSLRKKSEDYGWNNGADDNSENGGGDGKMMGMARMTMRVPKVPKACVMDANYPGSQSALSRPVNGEFICPCGTVVWMPKPGQPQLRHWGRKS